MFKFLRERRQREVLTLCELELARTQRPYAVFATPHDFATQAALLERATAADLTEHPIIKRLAFLHRLLAGLATGIEDSAIPAFIDEARALGLTETDGIRLLLEQQCKQALAEHGPAVIERTATGHHADTRGLWTEIQGLKQTRQYADLECVLLELVASEEHLSQTKGNGVATGPYWDLAVLYRKLKRTSDEIAILERFEKQTHGPGAMPRKLLERLMKVSGRTIPLPPKPVYDPRPRRHNFMAIVGESYRQDVLRAALETYGNAENAVVATLECEPQNEFDANAVVVKIGDQPVGYLSRDVAERFRPFIAVSPTPVTCKATLRGGTEDKPHIGLVLDFSPVHLLRDDPAL
jgi:hypothetical protein